MCTEYILVKYDLYYLIAYLTRVLFSGGTFSETILGGFLMKDTADAVTGIGYFRASNSWFLIVVLIEEIRFSNCLADTTYCLMDFMLLPIRII